MLLCVELHSRCQESVCNLEPQSKEGRLAPAFIDLAEKDLGQAPLSDLSAGGLPNNYMTLKRYAVRSAVKAAGVYYISVLLHQFESSLLCQRVTIGA